MKSPLVEALRQANAKASSPDEPDAADDNAVPTTVDAQSAETDGLMLLETMEILPLDVAGADPPETGALERNEVAAALATETMPESRYAAPTRLEVSGTSRRSALARLGLYTPLICLLLAIATAAMHFVYRNASSSLAASPVASMPDRPAGDAMMPGSSGSERFPLLRAAGESALPGSEEMVARSSQGPAE